MLAGEQIAMSFHPLALISNMLVPYMPFAAPDVQFLLWLVVVVAVVFDHQVGSAVSFKDAIRSVMRLCERVLR